MLEPHPLASSSTPAARFSAIGALADPTSLQSVLGPITAIDRQPLGTVGFSGSTHDRLQVQLRSGARRSLILKAVHLGRAWTAYRTGDVVGREAALLGEPRLQDIWTIFSCPYLAYAAQEGEVGLLMDDLAESLLPDVDEPLSPTEEDRLLATLAAMHARYWDAPEPELPWLMSPAQFLAVLGPGSGEEEASRGAAHPLFELVTQGWRLALDALPSSVAALLRRPPEELVRQCAELPKTIIHGDAKVANFALLRDGGVAAFDWAWIGAGPCTFDLCWYLAVNARRLARPREEVAGRYRTFLQSQLGEALPDDLWERLMRVGMLCGALMLLWAKAHAVESGAQDAIREWNWWVDQLRSRQ